jgi:PAS domain S-box-containing protein
MKDQSKASSFSPTPATFIIRLAVGVLLINLFVIALKGYSLHESRVQYEERAAVTTQNLSLVLEQNIGDAIGKIDVVLSATAEEIDKQIAGGGINALALNSFMSRQQSRLPELDGLRMADARGEVAYGTDMVRGAQKSVADREYFKRHRNDAKAGLILSSPLVSRVTGKWSLILARRVNNPNGSFAGLVYGVIPMEHFLKLFASIDVGRHGSITLRDADMGLVARHPKPVESGSAVGQKKVSQTFRDLFRTRPDSGTYKAVYPVDSVERTYTYRRISPYPLYINVGLAEIDYLAEWRGEARRMSLIAALFFAVSLVASWLVYRDWKRKRSTVQALARQELKFRTIADFTYDWEFWIAPDGAFVHTSPSCERITGHSADDFYADPALMTRIVHPDDLELWSDHRCDAIEDRNRKNLVFRIVHADGAIRWIEHVCQPVVDESGTFLGTRCSHRDITERKKDEESLCRINRTLRTLTKCNETLVRAEKETDLLHAVCRVITEDGGYRLAWVGYAENDDNKSIRPMARAGIEDGYLDALDITWSDSERGRGPSGTAIRTGMPCLMKDIMNDPRFSLWRDQAAQRGYRSCLAIPMASAEGVFGSLNIYSSEADAFDDEEQELMVRLTNDLVYGITALRTREKQEQTAEALRESLEQYRRLAAERGQEHSLLRALLDSIPDLIFFKDAEGVYLGCNKAFEAFCGRREKELIAHTDLDLFPREVGEFFREMDRKMMSQRSARRNEEWVNYPDGRRVLLDTLKTPFYDQNADLLGLIGISRDITERIQAEEERKTLEVQLQQAQKMEAVGQLAGGIAHDFNNILTAIIGYSEVILLRMEKESPLRRHMEQVLISAERAAELTKGLLAFSRKQVLDTRPIDLGEVVHGLKKMLARIIPEDIEFRTTVAENKLTVMADKGQIEQVLMNLVTNAKDSMPKGGILSIDASPAFMDESFAHAHGFAESGRYVCISVSDTGHGMDSETQRKIFEPFFTTKEVGKGTGLGMAIIYGIIKQHNGYIKVYSEPENGTTFRIYLPLSTGEMEEVIKVRHAEPHVGGTETILLVEDDPTVRDLNRMILEEAGYTVIEAVDGQDALDKFLERPSAVDMLVTDVIMPKLDGKSLCREIEKIRPEMKVLFMSGYTKDIVIKRGILDDELNFLAKPVTSSDLLRKVRHILDRSVS